jgi:hypothetical protein
MVGSSEKAENISININCYTIRFRKKRDKAQFLTFNEVFPDMTFKEFIKQFVKTIDKKCFKNQNQDRILFLKNILKISDTSVSGVVKKGHSSHESYVEDVKDNKPVTVNTIRSDQFNSSPFYFSLSLPKVTNKTIIFLAQSYKQYGFKEVFEDAFKSFFRSISTDEFICEFGTLSIAGLFKKYIQEGSIRKIRLRKYGLIPQVEDLVQDSNYNPKDYEVEMSIKAKRSKKGFLKHLRDINFDNSSFVEIFKVDNFSYDDALVEISSGGRKRVLNFSDPGSFAASYDVTKKAGIDKITKHPDFNKLGDEAIQILNQEIIPHIK